MVIVSLVQQYCLTAQKIYINGSLVITGDGNCKKIKPTPLCQVCHANLAISCCGNLAISEQFQSSFRAVSAID